MARKRTSRNESSWKKLQSEVMIPPGRSISLSRRLRRLGKGIIGLFFALILGAAIFGVLHLLKEERFRTEASTSGPKRPIRRVILNTDGVLNSEWLHENLQIDRNVDLSKVNIQEMRDQLLRHGQIRAVRVRREYPDELVFDISEYRPFAKIVAVDSNGKRFLLMVSPEGNVYRGINYPTRIWAEIPFLSGVNLQRNDYGFRPIQGMDRIYELWETTRKSQHAYFLEEWVEIDIGEYFPQRDPYPGVIKVRSRKIPQIVFTPREYLRQLTQLDHVQHQHLARLPGYILRVDLTALGQAAVQLAK